ncbi:MAG: hypothetical protein IMF19_00905 [Proteobacteria bacterium]|nr:hypothetical protein [Pseudomonadota bacterium]
MLTEKEIKLVTHLSNGGKGLIQITEIISRQRIGESDYDLLTAVAECVNHRLPVTEVYIK